MSRKAQIHPAMPMAASDYRRVQAVMPGVDALYRSIRAICDARLVQGAQVMIVGAGGGREIEALATSPKGYWLTGVDPSADMLAIAQDYVVAAGAEDRVRLVQGHTTDLPDNAGFDAATSILVMHFLPDDGAKKNYLHEIRQRLTPGASYLHVDVSFGSRAEFEALAAAMREHAALVGLEEIADAPSTAIAKMAFEQQPSSIVSEARTIQLFAECGFRLITPFYRGLWYAGWWCEAV
ncbi:MAG: class I SAM-dependent methyltransferase [Sphingorhabdus sp.]